MSRSKIKIKPRSRQPGKSLRKKQAGVIVNSDDLYRVILDKNCLPKKNGAQSRLELAGIFKKTDKSKVKRYSSGEFDPDMMSAAKSISAHIVITTMIWKRHDIFRAWALGVKRLKKSFKNVKIDVMVAGSEGRLSKDAVSRHGFDYVEAPNSPLGRKSNIRLRACEQYGSDYVMLCGSDDIFSDKYFAFILNAIGMGHDEIAPLDIYYCDILSKYSLYSNGNQGIYRGIKHSRGEPLAPGRVLSRKVLDEVNWRLWLEEEDKYLDKWPRDRIKEIVENPLHFSCRENGLVMCDVKKDVNMTKMKVYPHFELVDEKYLEQEIPELTALKRRAGSRARQGVSRPMNRRGR